MRPAAPALPQIFILRPYSVTYRCIRLRLTPAACRGTRTTRDGVSRLFARPRPAAPLARVAYTLLTHVPYAISYGNLLCTLNLRLHNWNLTHSYRRSDRDPRARTSDQCTDTTGPTQRRRAGVLRENTGALPLRACDRACVPPCATSTRRDAASGIDRRVPSRSTRGKGAVPSKMVALS